MYMKIWDGDIYFTSSCAYYIPCCFLYIKIDQCITLIGTNPQSQNATKTMISPFGLQNTSAFIRNTYVPLFIVVPERYL